MTKGSQIIPLDQFFSLKPIPYTNKLKRVTFLDNSPFSGKPVECFLYQGREWFLLDDVAKFSGKKYNTVQKANQRARKKQNKYLRHPMLVEIRDYIQIQTKQILLKDNRSANIDSRGESHRLLFSIPGLIILLSEMNGEAKNALFYEMVHFLAEKHETQKYFPYKPKQAIDHPRIGNTIVACTGELVDSRGEANILYALHDLKIPYQAGKKTWLPQYKTHVTPDFYLIGEPTTIIEYWGKPLGIDKKYDTTRIWKEKIYPEMEWRLIPFEHYEADDIPKIKAKIIDELNRS